MYYRAFLIRFLDCILKQKKISEMASQQLLLDTYSLKTLVMQLPVLNDPESSTATSKENRNISPVYSKLINSRSSHIEMILKLIGTPEDMLLERFRIMWPEGQSADLQMIMALKATKKNDQQIILEMFGLSTAKVVGAGKIVAGTATTGPIVPGASGALAAAAGAPGASSSFASTTASYTAASAQAASAAAFSSMKTLTQDLSSTARSAVGNLKWT